MRALYLSIPAGLALTCAGIALYLKSQEAHVESVDIVDAKVRHFVTPQMIEETSRQTLRPAPPFKAVDSEGKGVDIAQKGMPRPQFVYFVLDGCPCSIDAEPLFHDLQKRYLGKIDFVSVTDANKANAHRWSVQMLVNYPVVPDPDKKIIHAFGARASVYSCLVSVDGKIVKMWPGYSAGLLQEINATLAKEIGQTPQPFDTKWAPKEKATGCSF